MLLAGQTALVTGSSRGIGLGVARAFLDAGARVVATSEQPAEAVPAWLNAGNCRYLMANQLEEGAPERVVREAWELLGGLDVLVNNVGTYREPPLGRITRDDFDRIFRLNVWAPMAASIAWAGLAGTRGGKILFTSSLNATRSEPAHVLYDPSKGAVHAMIRQLAIELAPRNVCVLGVAPGLIETPLTDFGLQSDPAAREAIRRQIPLGRIGTVEEVAPWYVFLASPQARYATGLIVNLDGGLDAQQMPSRPIGRGEGEGEGA